MPADPEAASGNRRAMEQLRDLYAAAEGEYRARFALQLGLVIADLVAELPDDDQRLSDLAMEGLLMLDEGMAGAGGAAPTSAVERARNVLSRRVRPPAAPKVFSIQPEVLGMMGNIDPTTMRSAVEAMRFMMPDLPEGDPTRIMMQSLLPLFDTDLIDGFRSGRWKPEYDKALAGLDRLEREVAAAGMSLDPQVSALFDQISARLHQLRESSIVDGQQAPELPRPATPPSRSPLPDKPHPPSGEEMQRFLRAAPALNRLMSALPEDEPGRVPMQALMRGLDLMNALTTRQWTAEHDEQLAALQRLAGDAGMAEEHAAWAELVVALARAARCETLSESPNPAEWPGTAELTEVVTELENALDRVPAAAGSWTEFVPGAVHFHAASLLLRLARDASGDTVGALLARAREHIAKVPPQFIPDAQRTAADIALAERLVAGDVEGIDEDRPRGVDHGSFDAGPPHFAQLAATVNRVRRTGSPADLAATVEELRALRRSLPAGHPQHVIVLTWLADLLGRLSLTTRSPEDLVDALEAAIEAVSAAPRNAMRDASAVLVHLLGRMVAGDQRVGPFEPAEAALSAALCGADPDDAKLRLVLTLGLAGVGSLRARGTGDPDLRRRARDRFAEVERLLGESAPTGDWLAPAWLLLNWTASQATLGGDPEAAALAMRMADQVERVLVDHPELAEQMSTQFSAPTPAGLASGGQGVLQALRIMKDMLSVMGGSGPLAEIMRANITALRFGADRPSFAPPSTEDTHRLATQALEQARSALGGPPDAESLQAACADLRVALTNGLDDNSLRQQVNGTLGLCLARLYPLGDKDIRTLTDAIEQLNRALAGSEHAVPTVERADLMDVLARCYREAAEHGQDDKVRPEAARAAQAALRELARCVLVADETDRALEIAGRANEIVARAVGWCLADEHPGAAAEIAEAGRSLVLASVVLSGRVESVLRGAGEDAAADAWRRNDAEGKLASLNTLWQTRAGGSLLNTPTAREISALLAVGSSVDGLVYLVPPATGGARAHAVAFRAGLGNQFEMIKLPELRIGSGTPLGDYLAAFGAALDSHATGQRAAEGFRGTAHGREWAQALDRLGVWVYEYLIEPLVRHTRGWSLDRPPHLMLVPLGEFAAIPYAAAWMPDENLPGGRRYAVHDLVLSHAVSARLFGEVARRPHQPLTERVVLVPDATGEFPYARATARELVARLHPAAEVYDQRAGCAERILAALPGKDRQGASLFHLSTHATTEPVAQLWAGDGWLPLGRILEQARGRAPDSPGGLVIANACLTDSTRSHYDESVTLATALLTAGATGVIGTRWPVDDDTTAILTYHLHHRLALGNPPAEALRLAQLDMLDPDPRPRPGLHRHLAAVLPARRAHPASWAAFTYHGT